MRLLMSRSQRLGCPQWTPGAWTCAHRHTRTGVHTFMPQQRQTKHTHDVTPTCYTTHAHTSIHGRTQTCSKQKQPLPRKTFLYARFIFCWGAHPSAEWPDTVTWIQHNSWVNISSLFLRPFITQDAQGSFICTMPVIWQHHSTNE